MKLTDAFHLSDPPPWSSTEASVDLLVAPALPGRHACGNCPAMCCWFVPVERDVIETVEDLDAIEQHLQYERLAVWVEASGGYALGIVTPCRLLDRNTCACTVHATSDQPVLCAEFVASTCWYRARFEAGRREEAVRLDGRTWPDFRSRIKLDRDGRVLKLPAVGPYELTRTARIYDEAAVLVLDIPEDTAPSADAFHDLLVYLRNFEGIEVVESSTGWDLHFTTKRMMNDE